MATTSLNIYKFFITYYDFLFLIIALRQYKDKTPHRGHLCQQIPNSARRLSVECLFILNKFRLLS